MFHLGFYFRNSRERRVFLCWCFEDETRSGISWNSLIFSPGLNDSFERQIDSKNERMWKRAKQNINRKGRKACSSKFLCYILNSRVFPPTDSYKQVFIYLTEVHTIILWVPIYKNFIEHSNYKLLSLLALGTSSRPTCHYRDNNKIIPPSNNLHILFNGMCKIL